MSLVVIVVFLRSGGLRKPNLTGTAMAAVVDKSPPAARLLAVAAAGDLPTTHYETRTPAPPTGTRPDRLASLQRLESQGARNNMSLKLCMLLAVIAVAAAGYLAFVSGTVDEGQPIVSVNLPATFSAQARLGQKTYEANCASCHGANAAGRDDVAPPLVHVIYEPGHHGDESFQRAVAQGVRAHHWPFGDMPPVTGLTRDDVADVVAYIRELQRTNGIR